MFFTTVQCISANKELNSLCGIELTIIRKGRLYQRKQWLFCPPHCYLEASALQNTTLTLKDILDAPKLNEIWDEILPYFEQQFIIFHQLPYNLSYLSHSLAYYQIPLPTFTFGSTMMLAKRLYVALPNCKLESLNFFLGLSSSYDQCHDTSLNIADIVMAMSKQLGLDDIEALFTRAGICVGSYHRNGVSYPDFLSYYTPPYLESSPSPKDPLQTLSLRNQVICFTGPLKTMTRSMAVKKITLVGGHFQNQVSSQTTLLVSNLYDQVSHQWTRKTSKLEKALLLKSQGQSIDIIDEDSFLKRLSLS